MTARADRSLQYSSCRHVKQEKNIPTKSGQLQFHSVKHLSSKLKLQNLSRPADKEGQKGERDESIELAEEAQEPFNQLLYIPSQRSLTDRADWKKNSAARPRGGPWR